MAPAAVVGPPVGTAACGLAVVVAAAGAPGAGAADAPAGVGPPVGAGTADWPEGWPAACPVGVAACGVDAG